MPLSKFVDQYSGYKPLVQKFCILVACFGAISVAHRLLAFKLLLTDASLDYVETYNPYRGFDPLAGLTSQYSGSLLNGLHADFILSLALAAILTLPHKAFSGLSFVLLSAFYTANLEHIRYNMANIDLSLIGLGADPTFLAAQLTPNQFVTFGTFLAIGAGISTLSLIRFGNWVTTALTAVALPFAFAPLFTINIAQPMWLQTHPLLPFGASKKLDSDDRAFTWNDRSRTALPIVEAGNQRKNLLLVYLEGVSEVSLRNGDMPNLQALAETQTYYSRYFAHQLVTVNGLYSTLTGQLPTFTGSSSDLLWFDMKANDAEVAGSLPNRLSAIGYHTAFIQSAELSFMSKDKMLPILGFDEIKGDGAFEAWHSRNGWGVDDLTLFENVIATIDVQPEEQPWMIATLTTGTHAPYNIPSDFLPSEPSDRIRALKWADEAVGFLTQALEARNLLENTIVVFTSDESREQSGGTPLEDEIALNWLPLIILDSDSPAGESRDYIMASDLPFLLMGKVTGTEQAISRATSEPIVFGNIIGRRFFWYEPTSLELWACDTADFACGQYSEVADLGDLSQISSVKKAFFPNLQAVVNGQ